MDDQRGRPPRGHVPFVVSTVLTLGLHPVPMLARPVARIRLVERLPGWGDHVSSSQAVALTFDDGPGPLIADFLNVLDRAGATATFFLAGEQVEHDPGRAAAIVRAGHEVGVHGYRHLAHLRHWPRDIVADMRRAKEVIEGATGEPTRFYRPPHGIFCLASWRECARQGWQRALWTRAAWDWEAEATPVSIADRIGAPTAGDVLLLHDADTYSAPGSDTRTLAALPVILDRLSAAGLRCHSLGELLRSPSEGS